MNMDQVGRSVEYRAWDGSTMWYNVRVAGFEDTVPSVYIKDRGWVHLYPCTTQQFTGLLDRHNKKIWEGDVVRCDYGIGQVIFHQGAFMIEWLSDREANMEFVSSRDGFSYRKGDEELEVVGNIFTYKK